MDAARIAPARALRALRGGGAILRLALSLLMGLAGCGGCGGRSSGLVVDGPRAPGACGASPLEIARATEAAQLLIAGYGCDGCNPDYAKGVDNLIGCVLYEVQDKGATWTVSFWVGEVCSFRYGASKQKLVIEIGKQSCQPTSISPAIELIKEPLFCRSDAECVCLSGSGVPFIGCKNSFHGPMSWTGSYSCEKCRCAGNRCVQQ